MEEFIANYAKVNEVLAARAKANVSFSDYKEGSASETVKYYTDRLVEYANEVLLKNPTDDTEKMEKVQYYIDKYSAKLAEAIDKENAITCRCPSVLITGMGNFPTAKKEKQNKAAFAHWEKTKDLYETDSRNYYFDKIGKLLVDSEIIRSDDKDAVQKIKEKIAKLETMPDPYGDKKAEIRRLKERLLILSPNEMKQGKEITINGEPATFANIVKIFDSFKPVRSQWSDEERYYLSIPLVFSDGKQKYSGLVSDEVNEDGTMVSTYGNAENGFKPIWKPIDDRRKFYMVINKISGSGNKAVIYSILKDLDTEIQKQKEQADNTENKKITINGESAEVVENAELMRLQILFDDKPSTETRSILKSNGFRWAPSQKAWQRLLNNNARYALNSITK